MMNRLRGKNALWLLPSCLFIIAGVVLRLVLRSSSALWEDEIIAATHAVQPLVQVFVNAAIHDMHPPLYFVELHFWSLFNQADWWLIANSVFLSLIALASMFIAVRRLQDKTSALIVTAVFAVLPVCLWMAEEVRMYALLSVLLIWMFYFTHLSFAEGAKRRLYIRTALLALAIVYTHAIGFVAVMFFGFYAGSLLWTRKAARREWLIWLAVFGGVGLLSLPMLAADMLHQADMPPLTGFHDIIGWMSGVVIGNGSRLAGWLNMVGLLTYFATVFFGLYVQKTRRVTLYFLVLPIVFCAIVGVAARPVFKIDFFSNFTSPFLAIVIGSLLAELPFKHGMQTLASFCVFAALLGMGVGNRIAINTTETYYRDAVAVIKAGQQPNDVIWAPQASVFCGIAWYRAGPHWGSPVSITPPLRPGSRWYKLFDLLGPDLVAKLDLLPKSQSITTADGLKIMLAAESRPAAGQADRLWLVTFAPRNDLPPDLPGDHVGALERSRSLSFPPLQVDLYEKR
jgi:mannosyltransferase